MREYNSSKQASNELKSTDLIQVIEQTMSVEASKQGVMMISSASSPSFEPPSSASSASSAAQPLAISTSTRVSSLLKTARGNSVTISEEARQRSENMMSSSISSSPPSSSSSSAQPLATATATTRVSSLLQTARGNSVTISEEARQRSENMMSSSISSSSPSSSSSSSAQQLSTGTATATTRVSSLLQTARGNSVTISEEARQRSENMMSSSISSSSPSSSSSSQQLATGTATATTRVSSLLQTARGNSVTISEEARQRSENMMSSSISLSASSAQPLATATATTRVSSLLQTARGNSVTISEEARQRSENMMNSSISSSPPPSSSSLAQPLATGTATATTRVSSLLQTARGNSVTISEEARQRSENMMSSSISSSSPSSSSSSQPLATGTATATTRVSSLLQTARGNSVTISEEARQRSENMMSSSISSSSPSSSSSSSAQQLSTGTATATTRVSSLLQTARGNSVTISEEARQRSENMMSSSISSSSPSSSSSSQQLATGTATATTRVSSLLQTARGNSVTISEEARQRSENMMSSSISLSASSAQPLATATATTRVSSLLQTARGNSVTISEEARQRSENMMSSSISSSPPPSSSSLAQPLATGTATATTRVSSLLQTARGNSVTISEEARQRSENMMSSSISSSPPPSSSLAQPLATATATTRVSSLLQTARGNSVTISEEARQRSENMMNSSISSSPPSSSSSSSAQQLSTGTATATTRVSSLLQTARGNSVTISEEARQRSENMMSSSISSSPPPSSSSSSSAQQLSTATATTRVSSLLQTARGNSVTISEEARQRSENMMSSSISSSPPSSSLSAQQLPTGTATATTRVSSLLQTARGNSVTISEEARQRSENMMNSSISSSPPSSSSSSSAQQLSTGTATATTRVSSLLQTARGNSVTISEEARQRSENMMSSSISSSPPPSSSSSSSAQQLSTATATTRVSSLLQTARGNSVTISEEARQRSENMMSSSISSSPPSSSLSAQQLPTGTATATTRVSSLLQTARGNSVTISEEARQRSENMMSSSISSSPPSSSSSSSAQQLSTGTATATTRVSSLLQTARGNSVTISEEARQRSENMMSSSISSSPPSSTLPTSFMNTRLSSLPTSSSKINKISHNKSICKDVREFTDDNIIHPQYTTLNHESAISRSSYTEPTFSSNLRSSSVHEGLDNTNKRIGSNLSYMSPCMLSIGKSDISNSIARPCEVNETTKTSVPCDFTNSLELSLPLTRSYLLSISSHHIENPLHDSCRYVLTRHTSLLQLDSHTFKYIYVDRHGTCLIYQPIMNELSNNAATGDIHLQEVSNMSNSFNMSSHHKLLNKVQALVDNIPVIKKQGTFVPTTSFSPSHSIPLIQKILQDIAILYRIYETPSYQNTISTCTPNTMSTNSTRVSSTNVMSDEMKVWLENQVRWVVWTLLSYERQQPLHYTGIFSSYKNILLAVYDRYLRYILYESYGKDTLTTLDIFKRPSTPPATITTTAPYSVRNHSHHSGQATDVTSPRVNIVSHKKQSYSSTPQPLEPIDLTNIPLHINTEILDKVKTSKKIRKFTRKNAVSPLQRCCDIQTFLWPLVVCFAVTSNKDVLLSTDKGINSSDQGHNYDYKTPAKSSLQSGTRMAVVTPYVTVDTPSTGSITNATTTTPYLINETPSYKSDNINTSNANSNSSVAYEITDGWWWSKVKLDDHLMELVYQGKLRDGCKLIIFHGIFITSSSASAQQDGNNSNSGDEEVILQLSVNNTRLCRRDALLGYCRSSYLSRGITMSSIKLSGGPVYAINVRVVKSPIYMSKIIFPDTTQKRRKTHHISPIESETTTTSHNDNTGDICMSIQSSIVLSQEEVKCLRKLIEDRRANSIYAHQDGSHNEDGSSGNEEFLDYLEDIDCDMQVKSIIKDMNRGLYPDHPLSDSLQRDIERVHAQIRRMRQNEMMKSMREIEEMYEYDSRDYCDVLVQCTHKSESYAYIRFPKALIGKAYLLKLQSNYMITNLKVIRQISHTQSTRLLLLMVSNNTEITELATKSMDDPPTDILYSQPIEQFSDNENSLSTLRSFMMSRYPSDRSHSVISCLFEASFICTITQWYIVNENNNNSSSSSSVIDGNRTSYLKSNKEDISTMITIEILASDISGVILLLKCDILSHMLPWYKSQWLKEGEHVFIDHLYIQQIDYIHDILVCTRHERTTIIPLQKLIESNSSKSMKTRTNDPKYASSTKCYDRDKTDIQIVVSSEKYISSMSQYKERCDYLFHRNNTRFQALRQHQITYLDTTIFSIPVYISCQLHMTVLNDRLTLYPYDINQDANICHLFQYHGISQQSPPTYVLLKAKSESSAVDYIVYVIHSLLTDEVLTNTQDLSTRLPMTVSYSDIVTSTGVHIPTIRYINTIHN